jgi:polysaccharide chain length determinant protein (PEP-CTERM system associated)
MTNHELTFQDYLTMLRRHWLLIVVLSLIGAASSYTVSRFLKNEFTSQASVLVQEPNVPTTFVAPVANNNIGATLKLLEQEVMSRTQIEPLIRRSGIFGDQVDRVSMDSLVRRFVNSNVAVDLMKPPDDGAPSPGFTVAVEADRPDVAQALCASLTSMFIDENVRRREQQTRATMEFLTGQIDDAKAKLDQEDAKLAAFQAAHPGSLPNDEQSNLGILAGLSSEMAAMTSDITHAQQDKSLAESMLQQQIATQRTVETGKNPQTLGEQLSALQTELANLQSKYTDRYPDVVKVKGEIAELQKKLADADSAKIDASDQSHAIEPVQILQLRAQIKADTQEIADKMKAQQALQLRIAELQHKIEGTPTVDEEFKELTRDHESAQDFYNNLLRKRDDSKVAVDLESEQQSEQLSVLNSASYPGSPSFPNRPLFALGGLGGGLLIGLGLAFLLETRDTSLRSERDVEMHLQLPVIANIPTVDLRSSNKPQDRILTSAPSRRLQIGEGA